MSELTLLQLKKAYDAALEQIAAESFLALEIFPGDFVDRLRAGNNPAVDPNTEDLPGKLRMTAEQAQGFVARYTIIDAYQNDATGFSAVALRDTATPGRVVLAVRSTELNNDRTRDLGADLQIFTSGFAFDQILSAEDFLERVQPQLQPGEKIDLVGYSLSGNIVRTLAAMHPDVINQTSGSNVVFNATGLGEFRDPTGQNRSRDVVLQEMMELYRRVEADPNNATDVPVHLLPLQLTAIAAAPIDRTDPNGDIYSTPRQDFAQAYIQNRYGTFYNDFGRTVAEPSFAQYFGVALSGFDVTAVANSGSHPAPFGIAIEGQPVVEIPGLAPRIDYLNTHSLTLIADSLRLQILFKQIDDSISTDVIEAIFQASSASAANTLLGRAEKDTLENALDAVRKALLPVDQNVQPTPSSDTAGSFGNIPNRTAFHNNITAVEHVLPPQSSPYRIETLVNRPLEEVKGNALLEDEAGKGLAYRYALTVLNPFAIIGPTYSQHNPNGELALFDPTTGLGTITPDYIQDRGLFLAAKVALNQANLDGPLNPFALTHFHDNTLMYDIPSGLSISPGMQREYIFGSDNAETLTGGLLFTNDHLYGADGVDILQGLGGDDYLQGDGGNDTLDGGSGADRMIGGQGNDTYLVDNAGDQVTEGLNNGSDTVQSSVSFALAENLEDLTLTGTNDLNGTGNDLDNLITGNSGMNRLEGKGGTDHLIGNGGNDILIGGTGGEDLLEGGIGFDTYLYNAGDGLDRIEDSDADGVIKVNGHVLAGGVKTKGDQTWESPDGTIEYVMSGTDLLVKLNGTQILIINENFQSGQFGIRLIDATALPEDTLPTISYDNGYNIDSISLDGDADGKHITEEGAINWIVQGIDGPEFIWADNPLSTTFRAQNQQVFGNGGSDLIIGDFNDRLDGGVGDDIIRANWGEDVVYGGAGRDLILGDLNYYGQALGDTYDDYLDGGSEQDSLSGMAGNDTLLGGEGDDELFADDSLVYAQRPMGNDYLDGGEGHDRLYAGMGDDALYGGIGNDRLFGDNRPEGEDVYVWTVRPEVDDVFQGYEFSISVGAGSPIFSAQGGTDYLDGGAGNDYLQGDAGDDVLMGGADADELWGDDQQIEAVEEGDDWLDGGAGDDQLVGGGGADTLFGGDGDDVLAGDYANNSTLGFDDILDGGAGSDELQGGGGDDVLDGGSENDRLFGEEGNDNLYGGTGDDQLQGGNGNDMLFGEKGVDLLAGQDGDDQLFGDDGDDQLSGGGGVDQLVGGLGDDLLQGEDDHDTLFGDEGNDELQGGDGNDALMGGVGSDVLFGDGGDDTLWGENGDDQLVGGAGDDLVDGGTGDDVLKGEAGMDTYRIGRGDGIDTIIDTAGEGNRIVFEDITSEEITVGLATDALVIQVGTSGQQLSIAGFSSNNALAPSAITTYQFADGTTFTHADMVARGMGIPATIFTSGTITGVVEAGGSAVDNLQGTSLNDLLQGGAGRDTLAGLAGHDILWGGAERDLVAGGTGNDTYLYNLGDGLDEVIDEALLGEGNLVKFGPGIAISDVQLMVNEGSIVVGFGDPVQGVLLSNTRRTRMTDIHDIDNFQTDDGAVVSYANLLARGIDIIGTAGNERLVGTSIEDRFRGGAGNDTLAGDAGSDRYAFNTGDGVDVISDRAIAPGENEIIFGAGITSPMLTLGYLFDSFNSPSLYDLVIRIGSSSDELRLTNFSPNNALGTHAVEMFRFADGTSLTYAQLVARGFRIDGTDDNDALIGTSVNDRFIGGTGNDVFEGKTGDDAYVFNVGDGIDTITDSAMVGEGNRIQFGTGIAQSDLTLTRDEATRTLTIQVGNTGNDQLRLLNFDPTGANGSVVVQTVMFADGSTVNLVDLLAPSNHAPTVANAIADQTVPEDAPFSFTVPASTFADPDSGDALTYSAMLADGSALPTWLAFDAATRTFSGTPLNGNVGFLNLAVTARDRGNLTATSTFSLNVQNVNDAPTVAVPLTDQFVTQGSLFSFVVPTNTFADQDVLYGDTLTYSATQADGTALPTWLTFNPSTRTFSGTPQGPDIGTLDVRVTAIDTEMISASSMFALAILPITGTAGNDTLIGTSGDDVIQGLAGDDVLQGLAGNDLLDAGSGIDSMAGGLGNDVYVVDAVGDMVTEILNQGMDTVQSSITYTLVANVENLVLTGTASINGTGNSLNNSLSGNSANNQLNGGAGADMMAGGQGNDTYVVDNVGDVVTELINEGIDRVQTGLTYTLGVNVENLTLTGSAVVNGTGNVSDNTLTGNSAANVLTGGAGNDIYVVGAGDTVVEQENEGTDTVQTAVTWTLSTNVENLILTGTTASNGTGNSLNNVLTGNSAANTLDGDAGDDTLNGGAGGDTLIGGIGNDTYIVDNVGDVVSENFNEGTDLVRSSVTYTLGANVENLTLTGMAAINATGNTLDNALSGNSGANVLDGGGGADVLTGGRGNDTYVVDDVSDVVTEAANQGTDTVQSAITYILGADVENLTLTGPTAIDGTGNSLNNILTGNSAENGLTGLEGHDTLDGGGGADSLAGGLGNDTYMVDNIGDMVMEYVNEGTDLVQSSASYALTANVEHLTLTGTGSINGAGNALNNRLTGNSAANQLAGGAGNDTYVVSVGDTIVENVNEGTDTVQSDVSWTLGANLEHLTLTGTAAIDATGNTLNNRLTGNTAANQLAGGAGNDTLRGGLGNDTYLINRGEGQDVIVEDDSTAGNSDRIQYGMTINPLDLVISRQVNDLRLAVHGSADQVTIRDWYVSTNHHLETVQAGNGALLLSTRVDQLIQAMASFSQQSGLTWDQAIDQRPQDVQTILAANWQ